MERSSVLYKKHCSFKLNCMAEENNKQLVEIVQASGIVMTEGESIIASFSVLHNEALTLIADSNEITVVDENDKEGMEKAAVARKSLKRLRGEVEDNRVSFKEGYIKKGRAVDDIAKMVKGLIEPVEKKLDDMEKTGIRAATERREKTIHDRFEARVERLKPYVTDVTLVFGVKDMPDESFEKLLETSKTAHEARMQKIAEEKEIADKAAAAKIEEDKRIREENEKLKREQAERDEKDRIEREARAETDRVHKAEEDERLRIEREARESAERELQEKKDAEQRAENERRAEEDRQKEFARQAGLAPDKEKLHNFAEEIRNLVAPFGLSEAGQKIAIETTKKLIALSQEVKTQIENL